MFASPYHFWVTLGRTDVPPNAEWKKGLFDLEFEGNFSSNHPSITIMAFADGSVLPISDTVDPELFRALGTKKGKEVVDLRDIR